MAEPLDGQIVAEISRLLARISIANGFRTDAGQYVLSEESHTDIPETATVLEVLDDDEDAGYQNCQHRRGFLNLTIAVNYPAGTVTQALRRDARRILADVRQALGQRELHQFPAGVLGLEIAGRSMFIREAGSRYFRPEVKARASFTELHRSNP